MLATPLHPKKAVKKKNLAGDGQYKAPHELVEYSSTIFDTSLDDADRDFRPSLENASPPDQQRAKPWPSMLFTSCRRRAILPRWCASISKGWASRCPAGTGSTGSRATTPYTEPTTGLATECEALGTTAGQWRVASRLVHSAALSILLDVPAQNRHDAIQLAGLVADALDPPPKAQRRRVAKRLAGYFGAMLDGKHVLDAPKQWVWAVGDDGMAPAFPAGTRALYERHKGELVGGGYYFFHGRVSIAACADRPALPGHHADRPLCGGAVQGCDWQATSRFPRPETVARLLPHRAALVAPCGWYQASTQPGWR
jgi:hypothetical protein